MRKSNMFFIILVLTLLIALTGCTDKQEANSSFNIPEAEKIQNVLDDLSSAIMEKNSEAIDSSFSEGCPRRGPELDNLKQLTDSVELASYSQAVAASKRLRDGVVCTVRISFEGNSGNKSINSQSIRDIYFIYEKATWKIGDYNYYPYKNPTVVVGSESILYDAAYRMSGELSSKLRTDTEHLQSYGDIIMVGTPYDNASILDLEEKGLTVVRVTDDYPGSDLGIVQVMSNVENYRHVVVIQGSSIKNAENSVEFMTRYLKDNPYLNPGVYFIEENSLRKANPLELTTLVTLDMDKSSQRLKEVQKHMEANISVIEEELLSEKEQLLKEQNYLDNQYHEDYVKAFSRYEFYPEQSLFDSMVLINANFTDSRLCTTAFKLPYGNNSGTAYAYTDYINRNISLTTDRANDDKGPLLKDSTGHIRTAHEIGGSANELEITGLGTAVLRLSGFSSQEVYSITTSSGNAVFFNIDAGYAASPASTVMYTPELQFPVGDLISVYNDGAFLSCENNNTNLDTAEASEIYDRAEELFRLSGRPSRKAPAKVPFRKSALTELLDVPYDSEDIYDLLRNAFIIDDTPCLYSTLDEAREQLSSVMGSLLAVKCTRYLINTASRYPASQFDYARYAAGLINVEHPNVYAEASLDSRLLKDLSGGISNLLSDDTEKTQRIIDILKDISEEERNPDMFFSPDYCIANKAGSHRDKALLAFGLYGQLTGGNENAWIALGENSSYLVFEEEDRWKYLDCKYNVLKDYIDDDIYVAFNKEFVYNEKLDIGTPPDFIR
ncbi:MAG TPA: hypothetical protein VEG39_04340 [Clostridia bacterium]|nr:hypothetical protein [Clostridia bacterium]